MTTIGSTVADGDPERLATATTSRSARRGRGVGGAVGSEHEPQHTRDHEQDEAGDEGGRAVGEGLQPVELGAVGDGADAVGQELGGQVDHLMRLGVLS